MGKLKRFGLPLALIGALVATNAATAGADPSPTPYVTVADSLHNPRQMAFGPDGSLYVAEAGSGQLNATDTSGQCVNGPEGPSCAGNTSSITVIQQPADHDSSASRLVTGLLSLAAPDGSGAVGLDAVSLSGSGRLYGIMTYSDPAGLPQSVADQNGKLLRFRRDGSFAPVADIGSESLANPQSGHDPDSDPYGVLALHGKVFVADAANNTLLSVEDGDISTLATFEFRPQDAFDGVPTSIAAHDDKLYVGQLSSLEPGQAKVTVFDRWGNVVDTLADLSSVTGVAVASNGDVYATELFTGEPFNSPGALVKIPADGGSRTTTPLPAPGGVAVDHQGNVYVSINSVSPDQGAVIRLSAD
jgi:hypothetical protein